MSPAVRSGQFGISWHTRAEASPAEGSSRSSTSTVAADTGTKSSDSRASRRKGTSAPQPAGDLGDLRAVGGDDHALEQAALQGRLDRVREERLALQRSDVLAGDPLRAAPRGDHGEAAASRRSPDPPRRAADVDPGYVDVGDHDGAGADQSSPRRWSRPGRASRPRRSCSGRRSSRRRSRSRRARRGRRRRGGSRARPCCWCSGCRGARSQSRC